MNTQMVAGERLETLCEALREMKVKPGHDGMFHITWCLEARIGDPFIRAVRRIEAELMLHDAHHIGSPEAIERIYEQRAADAFVLLAQRITAALDDAE